MAGVVCANHKNNYFWLYVLKLTIIQSPEDVLSTVTTKTEIECISFSVVFVPCFFSGSFPTVCD